MGHVIFYNDGTSITLMPDGSRFNGHYKVRKGNFSLKKGASREVWHEHEVWWNTP